MKFKKIINVFLLIFFTTFSIMFCLHKFNLHPLISGNDAELQVYEWWHIESFEGGGANRQNYLNNLCIEYEKQNPNILFMVRSVSVEQLESALSQSTPHLFSFSEQVAPIILPYLKSFDREYGVQDNFLESATYNGKLMALPFIASGYCHFTKTNSTNTTLYTGNNNAHNATHLIQNQVINGGETLSSYQCYCKFVNSNDIQLLGTARDLFRIKNLESLGRFSVSYEPVSTFTDLIQYIGMTSSNKTILDFVDFVLSDTNQRKLANLSLFSTKHLKLYNENTYSQMESALSECYVPNIFVY